MSKVKGFSALKMAADQCDIPFDVVIIGSGYGGSVAAWQLSQLRLRNEIRNENRPLRIAVLERGRQYQAGEFPDTFSELPGHVRITSERLSKPLGNPDALVDIRLTRDMAVVQGAGVGGGSLINAGVMFRPDVSTFDNRWPKILVEEKSINDYFAQAEDLLGANTLDAHQSKSVDKAEFMKAIGISNGLSESDTGYTRISVAMNDGNGYQACSLCGDCASGCNHNAKMSLDKQILTRLPDSCEVFSEVYVESFKKHTSNDSSFWTHHWTVCVKPVAQALQVCGAKEVEIRASMVIIAAGSLGSTELLMRSRCDELRLSTQLGKRFSGNGDSLVVGWRHDRAQRRINAVSDETKNPSERAVGPTITRFIKVESEKPKGKRYLVQEMAVPAPLRRLFLELFATVDTVSGLAGGTDKSGFDPAILTHDGEYSSLFAVMGDDDADGELVLIDQPDERRERRDGIQVYWPGGRDKALYQDQLDAVARMLKASDPAAKVYPNPMWRIGSVESQSALGLSSGAPITVHPLGGCPMGNDSSCGVVDHGGRVFNPAANAATGGEQAVHQGLYVLDGSIIPCALGVNPALTIAMLSLRATDLMLKDPALDLLKPDSLTVSRNSDNNYAEGPAVPVAQIGSSNSSPDVKTKAQFKEQLVGDILIDNQGHKRYRTTLKLIYEPLPLATLFDSRSDKRVLNVVKTDGDHKSTLSLQLLDNNGVAVGNIMSVDVEGELKVLVRKKEADTKDMICAIMAVFQNRVLRDLVRALRRNSSMPSKHIFRNARQYVTLLYRYAKGAAERYEFEYTLNVSKKDISSILPGIRLDDAPGEIITLKGEKVVTYGRHANPWRQMTELGITQFPGLARSRRMFFSGTPHNEMENVLSLDTRYAARQDVPLFRVVAQKDGPTAWLDLLSLVMFILRIVLRTHAWSLRSPDLSEKRVVRRLPGEIKVSNGTVEPFVTSIPVSGTKSGFIRMTRYPNPKGSGRPVLLIHGYSASGNTFSYHLLKKSLAGYLWDAGREVWIVDLRTSSGLSTRSRPWTFEEIASQDVMCAIEYVHKASGLQRVDVVAHCMGAAMLSMCILDDHAAQGGKVADMLGNIVLSQVGPVVQFSMGNVFRAYLLDYLLPFLGADEYRFHVKENESALIEMIDVLLATIPYSDAEFRIENPFPAFWRKTPWVGSRHRMDLLYGRTYESDNLPNEVLDNIDDLFGPLNLKTLSQVIHLARNGVICDSRGVNRYVSADSIKNKWKFNTLYMIGSRNGMIDPATADHMADLFAGTGRLEVKRIDGFGHQDMLIGIKSDKEQQAVFGAILGFLQRPIAGDTIQKECGWKVLAPSAGPVLEPLEPVNGGYWLPIRMGLPAGWINPTYLVTFPWPYHDNGKITCYQFKPGFERWVRGKLLLQSSECGISLVCLLVYRSNPYSRTQGGISTSTTPALPANSTWKENADFSFITIGEVDSKHIQSAIQSFIKGKGVLDGCVIDVPGSDNPSSSLKLAVGSCQYPRFLIDSEVAFSSWRNLAEKKVKANNVEKPDLLLLLGDQIYIDATAGYFDPQYSLDVHAKHYLALFSAPQVRSVLASVPALMMLDDHEIADNWFNPVQGSSTYTERKSMRDVGVNAYRKFQRGLSALYRSNPDELWYNFAGNGYRFFMLDTRTERDGPGISMAARRLIGDRQKNDLEQFLTRCAKDTYKPVFIASASMIIPRSNKCAQLQVPDYIDNWSGYPADRDWLLEQIYRLELQNVIFLSGDEHLSCYASGSLSSSDGAENKGKIVFHSIHCSALYAPFPFANSKPRSFLVPDSFGVGNNGLKCSVKVERFMPGDGFMFLRLEPNGNGWKLDIEHCGENGNSQNMVTPVNLRPRLPAEGAPS